MLEEKSKFLSYLLRHKPEAANLTLDSEGFVAMAAIVTNTATSKTLLTFEDIQEIVRTDEKQRYTIRVSKTGLFVRANQGHSVKGVDIKFKTVVPPPILYHGTTKKAVPSIMKGGLIAMNRQWVHLSGDLATAENVANRRKIDTTVLRIDTAAMLKDGIKFYISDNGVYQVATVLPKYIITHERT